MRKSRMLKHLLYTMIVTGAVLAGCSMGSHIDTQGPASTLQSKPKVEISFWHVWSDKESGPIIERVEAFNKSQNSILVKVLGNQDASKQRMAITGTNPPDIALTYWNNIGQWAESGDVLELESYIRADSHDTSSYIQAAVDRMKVDGKYFSLPFTMSMANTLLYNKKAYKEAGLTKPPETTDELLDYAKKLTKRDEHGSLTQLGFLPDYPWTDNVFWPVIFGGSWIDTAGKVTPNKRENIQAIEYQRKFYEQVDKKEAGEFLARLKKRVIPQDPILNGELAMMIGWEYGYAEERKSDGPLGVAQFPHPADRPDLKGSGIVSPRAVFIPKRAKHPAEAWEFMKWLLSSESQVEFSLRTRTIPSVRSALDDPRFTRSEAMVTMLPYLEWAKSKNLQGFPNSVYTNEYLRMLSEETDKVLKGLQSAQAAMDIVAEKIQPLADKAK